MKNPVRKTSFGSLKTLFIILFGLIILQSCDMSKYYFRMHPGGKNHQQRNITQEERASSSFRVSEEKAPISIDRDTVFENEQTDSPVLTNTVERIAPKSVAEENKATTQPKLKNESNEQVSPTRIKNKHQKSAAYLSPGEEIILIIYGVAMLIILGIGIAVFFISWIFAPALLALKIALWSMLGLSLFPTTLAIILLCM